MTPKLIITGLMLIMTLFFGIAFVIFNVVKTNLSRENVNKGAIKGWTIVCFILTILFLLLNIALTILPWDCVLNF